MKKSDLTIERVNNGFIIHEASEPGVCGTKYVFNSPSATAVGVGNLLEHGRVDRPKLPPIPQYPPNMGAPIFPEYHGVELARHEKRMLDACIAAGFSIKNEFKTRSTTAEEVRREQFERRIREEVKCHQLNFTNVDPQAWVTIQRHGPNTTECPNPGVYRIAGGRTGGRPGAARHYLKVERAGSLHYGTRAPGHFKVEYRNCPAWDSWPQFLQSSLWTQFRLVRKPSFPHEAAWMNVEDFSRVEPGDYMVKNHYLNNVIRVLEDGRIVGGSWQEATQRVYWENAPTWDNWAHLRTGSSWKQVAALPPL